VVLVVVVVAVGGCEVEVLVVAVVLAGVVVVAEVVVELTAGGLVDVVVLELVVVVVEVDRVWAALVRVELCVVVAEEDPPQAPSTATTTPHARTLSAPRRLTRTSDGCHSQSRRAADMVRSDGSEGDGP
jgi:hypothetical protein